VLIKTYNPEWPLQFQAIAKVLATAISTVDHAIEHIGSTSVPGLDAKDIIDIDIIYNEITDFDTIKADLVSIGYYHNGDQGINGREVFKRTLEEQHVVLDGIRHHLYLCHKSCRGCVEHILFRNYLRSHENARQMYQEMKHKLAKRVHQDHKAYAEHKEKEMRDFVMVIDIDTSGPARIIISELHSILRVNRV